MVSPHDLIQPDSHNNICWELVISVSEIVHLIFFHLLPCCWEQNGGPRTFLVAKCQGRSLGPRPGFRIRGWQSSRGRLCPGSVGLCPCGSGCPSVYIVLGRFFLLSAVVLSFLTTFSMWSFAAQLFLRTRKHNFVSAFLSFLTGVELQASLGEESKGRESVMVSVMSGAREFLGPLSSVAFSVKQPAPIPTPQDLLCLSFRASQLLCTCF